MTQSKKAGSNKNVNKNENVEVIQKVEEAVVESTVEVVQSPVAVSKASIANAIFKQMFGMSTVPARKDMIQRAMKEAKLTEKGAATYLQNYKAKHGLTKPKAVTA